MAAKRSQRVGIRRCRPLGAWIRCVKCVGYDREHRLRIYQCSRKVHQSIEEAVFGFERELFLSTLLKPLESSVYDPKHIQAMYRLMRQRSSP